MKFGLVILMLVLAWTTTIGATQQTKPEPAAWAEVKKLVGGTWKGTVGNGMEVALRFTLSKDGKLVESTGTVGDPAKPALRINARFGIDPVLNKVYYLDLHNSDTIYFGHCELKDKVMEIRFKAISGGPGEFINRESYTSADELVSNLFVVDKDGKEAAIHTLVLKRTKD